MQESYRKIFVLFFLLFIISPLGVVCNERSKELEIRRNINKANLSNLTITDFEWLDKSQNMLGRFDFIEIKNSSILGFKNIYIEVQAYNEDGTLTRFIIPLEDSIESKQTKKFRNVTTAPLSFEPKKTEIAIKSAEILYDKKSFSLEATDSIKILDFRFIVDNLASKTIIVEELKIINESKNYYKNIEYIINFLDQKKKAVVSRRFRIKEPIGPGETKTFKDFNIPGLPSKEFMSISLDVGSGDLLSSKEYLLSGGDEKYIDKSLIGIDFDDVPVPNADLRIKNYSWVNNAQGTIGTINIDISNNSRFKYIWI